MFRLNKLTSLMFAEHTYTYHTSCVVGEGKMVSTSMQKITEIEIIYVISVLHRLSENRLKNPNWNDPKTEGIKRVEHLFFCRDSNFFFSYLLTMDEKALGFSGVLFFWYLFSIGLNFQRNSVRTSHVCLKIC